MLLGVLTLLMTGCYVQPNSTVSDYPVHRDRPVIVDPDFDPNDESAVMPQFKCGMTIEESEILLMKFISKNLNYPKEARNENIRGTAVVSYVVNENGRLSDIDCYPCLHDSIRTELIRLISSMSNWCPGMLDGKYAKVTYNLPFTFRLE